MVLKKIVSLNILIVTLGFMILTSILVHDYVQRKILQLGFYDKIGIIVGLIFIIVGFVLFIFDKYEMYANRGILSEKVNLFKTLLVVMLVISSLLGIGGSLFYRYYNEKLASSEEEWSIGIYQSSSQEPFIFIGERVANPILTKNDITDIEAKFVADPFLIHENGNYFMFFEVLNVKTGHGDIGLATSTNGLDWSYSQIVLDERFHLSFPCVIKYKNEFYMIPETSQTKSVRLYKADNFPNGWSFVKTLLKGKNFNDNAIFHYKNTWWLFTETDDFKVLRLYYSDTLSGPWVEHPKSPIINGDANIATPGGNVIVFNNRIVRYTQDDDPYYGNQVWAFEITTLTKNTYTEKRIGSRPILKGFDNWNTRGMHHISPIRVASDRWIASVDGY